MSTRSVEMPLSGWGRFPVESCHVYRPTDIDQVAELVATAPHALIARGLGRSYGDASLNRGRGVIETVRLDHMLEFDPATGILRCEAAVSLAEILDTFLPRGFFFPVTPGTKYITVGGAIAADVHGKNHHRSGSMSASLLDFVLLTASGEQVRCSKTENAELFWATTGGMGITGVVLEARLQLRRVESAFMEVDYECARDLDDALERYIRADDDYDYGVAWIDCLATGAQLGRSVLMRANHAPRERLPARRRASPCEMPGRFTPTVPFTMPNATLSRTSMRIFNEGFYRAYRDGRRLVDCDRYFYPLDSIGSWNLIYGRRGVLQYQIVLPDATARLGLREVLEQLTSRKRPSFLAVLKSFGEAGEGLLSFPTKGYTLALDLPCSGEDLVRDLHDLDQIVARHGGRVYLAKDACLERELFTEMYPGAERFRKIKDEIDPEHRFSSSQARRLGLAESDARV